MWQFRGVRPDRTRTEPGDLNLESLEHRFHLSGNVVADLTGGTLAVSGDGGNNAVYISTFEDPTNGPGFRVEGFDKDGPTTINGGAVAEFFGVANLYVDLGDGNDDLAVSNDLNALSECLDLPIVPTSSFSTPANLIVPGWATLRMGGGVNRVGIGPATVGQRLLVETGAGEDQVGLCDVAVGSNLVIRTFGGNDQVYLHDSSAIGLAKILGANGESLIRVDGLVADDLVVQGGYHTDNVNLQCLSIGDDVVIQTLNGSDWVNVDGCYPDESGEEPAAFQSNVNPSEIGDLLAIQTGEGPGYAGVYLVDAGRMNILGGNQQDYFEVFESSTVYNLSVNTLGGDDLVELISVEALNVNVLTGLGDDRVYVGGGYQGTSLVEDNLVIVTDLGNDLVQIGERYRPGLAEEIPNEEVNIGDNLIVNTGPDIDLIEVSNYRVGRDATLDVGPGDDYGGRFEDELVANAYPTQPAGGVIVYGLDVAGNLNVFLGDGVDSAMFEYSSVGGNAFIDAGTGDDGYNDDNSTFGYGFGVRGVQIDQMEVGGSFWLNLGPGNDTGKVYGLSVVANAYFNGGTQDDSLSLSYVSIGQALYVFMGAGDDSLYLDDSTAANAWLYGQAGLNDLYVSGGNVFGSEHVYSFEQFVI